jgi:hypothetical protein
VGTGVTSGAGTANPFGAPELIPVFIWDNFNKLSKLKRHKYLIKYINKII